MTIEYRQTRDFTEEDLRRLFLSVGWESGRYPKRLVTAMRNSTHVISALGWGPADRPGACP